MYIKLKYEKHYQNNKYKYKLKKYLLSKIIFGLPMYTNH